MKRSKLKIDYPLLSVVVLLIFIGTLTVFSASYYELEIGMRQAAHRFFEVNLMYAAFGLVFMLAISFMPYEYLKRLLPIIVLITLGLMIYVIFFGIEYKGAKRWIKITNSVTFMPLEATKACLIIMLSVFVDRLGEKIKTLRSFILILAICSVFLVLAIPQKDLATILLMIILIMAILFVAGSRILHLIVMAGLGLLGGVGLLFAESYRITRITIWFQTLFDKQYLFTDEKRQIMNSIYAISSGEALGKGLGMSEFSKLRLPDSYSDFIFSVFAEEFGFVGSIALLSLFAFLIYRIFKIALECDDVMGFTLAAGVGILILLQVVANIGVALAIIPTTGIPLPFISKGGSSMIVLLCMIGFVLNISSSNSERKYRKGVN